MKEASAQKEAIKILNYKICGTLFAQRLNEKIYWRCVKISFSL